MTGPFALVVHGGAGVVPGRDYGPVEAHLLKVAEAGAAALADGASALDVVERAVVELEASGLYVAGRGSAPNAAGVVELDASIMDGARRRAGAVCALRDIVSPVAAARLVMEQTPHVLLAGDGARDFALARKLAAVADPADYYVLPAGVEAGDLTAAARAHGTVGAVALDRAGRFAAATSTGGLFGKYPGRVGDTAIPGLGTWADAGMAISCTGTGEAFMLAGGAGDVAARVRYGGQTLGDAAAAMLAAVAGLGGDGGLIALAPDGIPRFAYNSPGLKRAAAGSAFAAMAGIA